MYRGGERCPGSLVTTIFSSGRLKEEVIIGLKGTTLESIFMAISVLALVALYIIEIWINIANQRRVSDLEIACYYLAMQMARHSLLADGDPLQAQATEKTGASK